MVETRKQMTEEIHKSQQSFSKHYDKEKWYGYLRQRTNSFTGHLTRWTSDTGTLRSIKGEWQLQIAEILHSGPNGIYSEPARPQRGFHMLKSHVDCVRGLTK